MNHKIGIYLLLVGLRRSSTSVAYHTEAQVASCSFSGRLASAAMAFTGSRGVFMRDGESRALTNEMPPPSLEGVISTDLRLWNLL